MDRGNRNADPTRTTTPATLNRLTGADTATQPTGSANPHGDGAKKERGSQHEHAGLLELPETLQYLNGQIRIFDLINAMEARRDPGAGKSQGAVYTPEAIVNHMILISGITPDMQIWEPSCGHGAFVFGILEFLRRAHGLQGEELRQWLRTRICATDINPRAISDLHGLMQIYFRHEHGIELKMNGPGSDLSWICTHDALTTTPPHPATQERMDRTATDGNPEPFDLCIGNPPYMRTRLIPPHTLKHLRQEYATCRKGNVDLYYAFVEQAIRQASNTCLIIPNGFLTNASGKALRELLKGRLKQLINFRDTKVFPGTGTYTCIIRTGNASGKEYADENERVDMAGSGTEPGTAAKKTQTQDAENGADLHEERLIQYSERITETPAARPQMQILDPNRGTGTTLNPVLSGIATLRDRAFLAFRDPDGTFHTEHGGERHPIEAQILAPYLKLTKIRDSRPDPDSFMIFPYQEDNTIIPEHELQERFPMAYAHLCRVRGDLEQRDKGNTGKYESWYAYGRKQGLHREIPGDAVIIPNLMGGANVPRRVDLTRALAHSGRLVFTSGFIIPDSEANQPWLDHLAGPAMRDYARQHGKPWPGKHESHYTLTARQIAAFKPGEQNAGNNTDDGTPPTQSQGGDTRKDNPAINKKGGNQQTGASGNIKDKTCP